MVLAWCRFAAAVLCLGTGLVFMAVAVFGVNRFQKALNRMHAAALGDTLGILFIFLGLIIVRGFSLDSLKLFLVILFFWIASPVSGHMISRLEAMTDEDLGEILIINRIKESYKEEKSKEESYGEEKDNEERHKKEKGREVRHRKEKGREENHRKEKGREVNRRKEKDKEENHSKDKNREVSYRKEKSREEVHRKGKEKYREEY